MTRIIESGVARLLESGVARLLESGVVPVEPPVEPPVAVPSLPAPGFTFTSRVTPVVEIGVRDTRIPTGAAVWDDRPLGSGGVEVGVDVSDVGGSDL